MLFNSYPFLFAFLPATVVVYFFLNRRRLTLAAKSWLVLVSLFFYAYWNIRYLPVILISMLFNYALGTALSGSKQSAAARKNLLWFGVTANLAVLAYFKYADFLIGNLNRAADLHLAPLHLTLPLGISFFTFTQIAYLVDTHRSEAREPDFLNYALFVTFFPHLIAGPIVHHRGLMPQFDEAKNKLLRWRNVASGLSLFSVGLFKKTVIADSFAVWAVEGFDRASRLGFFDAWKTSLSYTFQLYFDFSGYIDMAIGSALLFNIALPVNFNSPYKACDIQDFWRRWHITLTKFLRDYVYIPLGGNKGPSLRVYRNLLITFLVGGLWHGAAWTFVFWGFLHGLAMVLRRAWSRSGLRMNRWLGWFLTFNFVNITWIFFRAKSWEDALKVLRGMLAWNEAGIPELKVLAPFAAVFCLVLFFKNSDERAGRFRADWRSLSLACLLMFGGMLFMTKISEFLYFNF